MTWGPASCLDLRYQSPLPTTTMRSPDASRKWKRQLNCRVVERLWRGRHGASIHMAIGRGKLPGSERNSCSKVFRAWSTADTSRGCAVNFRGRVLRSQRGGRAFRAQAQEEACEAVPTSRE